MSSQNRREIAKKYQLAMFDAQRRVMDYLTVARDLKVRLACGETAYYDHQFKLCTRKQCEKAYHKAKHSLDWYRKQRRLYWEARK